MRRPGIDDHVLGFNADDGDEQALKDRVHALLQDPARCEVDPASGCWVYTGAWEADGEGRLRVGRAVYAVARVAAWLYLPGYDFWDTTRVVHASCRNPACFNPEHLRVVAGGSAQVAHQARRARGPAAGVRAHARRILALHARGLPDGAIARALGLRPQAVGKFLRRRGLPPGTGSRE